jgi:hypothetical protein
LDKFESKGVMCQLACGHYFHVHCIDTWLATEVSNSTVQNTCPLCQQTYTTSSEINASLI